MKLTLKALRVNKNMTQTEAAKAVGVSPSTWAHYEQGKTYPDVEIIDKIEKTFDVSYADILFLPQTTI